jgi:hypothetical protein
MSADQAKLKKAREACFEGLTDFELATARGVRLEDALAMLGTRDLKRVGRELIGPCPVHGGQDRFAVHPRKGKWNCRGSVGGNDAIGLVMHATGRTFVEAVQMLAGPRVQQKARRVEHHNDNQQPADNSEKAAWLWAKRRPITEDTPAARYLRKRGYTGRIPPTLAYLPSYREHPDTMIAAFGFAPEIEPGLIAPPQAITGVHLTRLTPQGVSRKRLCVKQCWAMTRCLSTCPQIPRVRIAECAQRLWPRATPEDLEAPNDIIGYLDTCGQVGRLLITIPVGHWNWVQQSGFPAYFTQPPAEELLAARTSLLQPNLNRILARTREATKCTKRFVVHSENVPDGGGRACTREVGGTTSSPARTGAAIRIRAVVTTVRNTWPRVWRSAPQLRDGC